MDWEALWLPDFIARIESKLKAVVAVNSWSCACSGIWTILFFDRFKNHGN